MSQSLDRQTALCRASSPGSLPAHPCEWPAFPFRLFRQEPLLESPLQAPDETGIETHLVSTRPQVCCERTFALFSVRAAPKINAGGLFGCHGTRAGPPVVCAGKSPYSPLWEYLSSLGRSSFLVQAITISLILSPQTLTLSMP